MAGFPTRADFFFMGNSDKAGIDLVPRGGRWL